MQQPTPKVKMKPRPIKPRCREIISTPKPNMVVSAATTMVHALTTRAVDIVLAGLLLIGGVIGAQYGALLTLRITVRIGVMLAAGGQPAGRLYLSLPRIPLIRHRERKQRRVLPGTLISPS